MRGVKLVVSDDHAGRKAARSATLSGIPWQRCQFHAIRNAMAHSPEASMRADVSHDFRRVFDAGDEPEATRRLKQMIARYQKPAPALASWLEENVSEALTVLVSPGTGNPTRLLNYLLPHHRKLRTTNGLERLNKEIKRRTRVATLFSNEASLLILSQRSSVRSAMNGRPSGPT